MVLEGDWKAFVLYGTACVKETGLHSHVLQTLKAIYFLGVPFDWKSASSRKLRVVPTGGAKFVYLDSKLRQKSQECPGLALAIIRRSGVYFLEQV